MGLMSLVGLVGIDQEVHTWDLLEDQVVALVPEENCQDVDLEEEIGLVSLEDRADLVGQGLVVQDLVGQGLVGQGLAGQGLVGQGLVFQIVVQVEMDRDLEETVLVELKYSN